VPSDCYFRRFSPVFCLYGLRSPQPPGPHAINRWRDGWCWCLWPFQWLMGSSIVDDCTDTRIRFQPPRKTSGICSYVVRIYCNFSTCGDVDLSSHPCRVGALGIWCFRRCRCQTDHYCCPGSWKSNFSDPDINCRWSTGRNREPSEKEGNSFCRINFLWNFVVCSLSIFLLLFGESLMHPCQRTRNSNFV